MLKNAGQGLCANWGTAATQEGPVPSFGCVGFIETAARTQQLGHGGITIMQPENSVKHPWPSLLKNI
jgi:hypothetical protein